MKKVFSIAFLLLIVFGESFSQDSCACCTSFHQQFDFWVGEWNVYDTSGTLVGENHIEKIEDGCILNEHWKGAKGSTGSSFNYFDRADSTWNQLWIDASGNNLKLKGSRNGDEMVLESELIPGKKVDFYRNRISWTKNDDGSVRQLWQVLDKEGKQLAIAFDGLYKKK